jgi:hypothetical protein
MPLRDHFRRPVVNKHSWDSLHGGWPMMIVQQLFDILPSGYVSAPTVHFGKDFEVDVSAFEENSPRKASAETGHGSTTAILTPAPTLTLEADLADQDEFEVRIYDDEHERQLVAAIELVSPSNKDRLEHRRAFVAKVAALLQKDVCVCVVDVVTVRQANLYAELLDLIGRVDPQLGRTPTQLYCVTLRKRTSGSLLLDVWNFPLSLGQALPTLPIWLTPELRVLLPLEDSYEATCRLLHIT